MTDPDLQAYMDATSGGFVEIEWITHWPEINVVRERAGLDQVHCGLEQITGACHDAEDLLALKATAKDLAMRYDNALDELEETRRKLAVAERRLP